MNNSEVIIGDQAKGLLAQVEKKRKRTIRDVTRVVSVTSGKGGVGKTFTVLNTAIALSALGKSVLILDADLGLANIDVMTGTRTEFNLSHVVSGEKSLSDIIVDGPGGISIIPAASGVEMMCSLDPFQRRSLLEAIEDVADKFDYLIIDTAAGISADVMQFNAAATEIVLVVTEDPTSMTDAYAMIKLLASKYGEKEVSVLINNVSGGEDNAKRIFNRLAASVDKFLKIKVNFAGHVPQDKTVSESIRSQTPLQLHYPSSQAALAINRFAKRIEISYPDLKIKGGMQFFFQNLVEQSAQ